LSEKKQPSMKNISNVTAAILVGGLGTRLRSVVCDKPKVLAEISGKPFLAYLLDKLLTTGIRKVVFCSGYMGDKVEDYFGDTYDSLHLCYSREDEPLGTGGALRLALPFFSSEAVLVMNGDSYIDTVLNAYIDWFFEQRIKAALLLTKVDDTSRYGSVEINKDKTVAAFEEKCDNAGPGWINAGVYLLKRSLVSVIPTGKFYSLEREFFPSLADGELYGFCSDGRFIDIGTPEAYSIAESFFAVRNHEDFAGM